MMNGRTDFFPRFIRTSELETEDRLAFCAAADHEELFPAGSDTSTRAIVRQFLMINKMDAVVQLQRLVTTSRPAPELCCCSFPYAILSEVWRLFGMLQLHSNALRLGQVANSWICVKIMQFCYKFLASAVVAQDLKSLDTD